MNPDISGSTSSHLGLYPFPSTLVEWCLDKKIYFMYHLIYFMYLNSIVKFLTTFYQNYSCTCIKNVKPEFYFFVTNFQLMTKIICI